jgi:hypothetical protein
MKATEQINLAKLQARHRSEGLAATALLISLGFLGIITIVAIS